jgi:hypothetical protein
LGNTEKKVWILQKNKWIIVLSIILCMVFLTGLLLWPKAEFTISSLTVSPTEIFVGDKITVSATVMNVGNADGVYTATLLIDGVPVESKGVSLSSGEFTQIYFRILENKSGDYEINVGQLKKTISIKCRGLLPTFQIGNHWVFKMSDGSNNNTWNFLLRTVETLNNVKCYVIDVSFTKPFQDIFTNLTIWYETSTLLPLQTLFIGEIGSIPFLTTIITTYNYTANLWPIEVGKEINVYETDIISTFILDEIDIKTETWSYTIKVEVQEEITIPAGTFTCFKLIEYAEDDTLQKITWYSDNVKFLYIKMVNPITEETNELLSYNLQP